MNDIVHDPEKGFEAIRLGVVKRLVGLMLSSDSFIRERCAMILTTLGGQAMGREAITHSPKTLKNLHDLIQDEVLAVRFKACLALEMIARAWMSADYLNYYGFAELLLHRLVLEEDQAIIIAQLRVLQHLFDQDFKLEAINKGAMPVMKGMLDHDNPEIIAGACGCIALLGIHPEGKKMINILQLLSILREKLFHQNREVRTKAAKAIMFATLITSNKLQALQLDMCHRLLVLAKDFHCLEIQINCIKALTNLAEAPEGRQILLHSLCEIQAIRPRASKSLDRHINTLLTVVQWKP